MKHENTTSLSSGGIYARFSDRREDEQVHCMMPGSLQGALGVTMSAGGLHMNEILHWI